MDSVLRVQARIGQRALLLTTAAVPLTGWAMHARPLHRKLTAAAKDPLTGLLRRDAYTTRARSGCATTSPPAPWPPSASPPAPSSSTP